MKAKVIITLSIVFTLVGIGMGVIADGSGNMSFLLISLTLVALFLIGMNISAFIMLNRSKKENWTKGYNESTKDIMAGVKKVYKKDGCDRVAKATIQILAKVSQEAVEVMLQNRKKSMENKEDAHTHID